MFASPRGEVYLGGDRWRWVLDDALMTILGRQLLLAIVTGRQREKRGRWLARFGLLSDSVVAAALSDFVQAFQHTVD